LKKEFYYLIGFYILLGCSSINDDYEFLESIIGADYSLKEETNVIILSLDGCIYCLDDVKDKINLDEAIDVIILFSKNVNTAKIFSKDLARERPIYIYQDEIPNGIFSKSELKITLLNFKNKKIISKKAYEIYQ